MSRNYPRRDVPAGWASSRNTDDAVAAAIFSIADSRRSPEAIWDAPTPTESDHVLMAVHEFVTHGDFELGDGRFAWGQETLTINV